MKVKNADEFYKILERKAIYPVFQPIVNDFRFVCDC